MIYRYKRLYSTCLSLILAFASSKSMGALVEYIVRGDLTLVNSSYSDYAHLDGAKFTIQLQVEKGSGVYYPNPPGAVHTGWKLAKLPLLALQNRPDSMPNISITLISDPHNQSYVPDLYLYRTDSDYGIGHMNMPGGWLFAMGYPIMVSNVSVTFPYVDPGAVTDQLPYLSNSNIYNIYMQDWKSSYYVPGSTSSYSPYYRATVTSIETVPLPPSFGLLLIGISAVMVSAKRHAGYCA